MASLREMYEKKKSENSWMGSVVEKKERGFVEGEKTHMENTTTPKTNSLGASQLDLYNEGALNIEEYVKNTPESVNI